MKVTAIQTSGAYAASTTVGRSREAPAAEPVKSLGADPAPIFTTDNRPQQLQQTEETSQQRRDADLERMVDTANEAIAHTRNHVQIERHKPTRRFVMKLVDGDSGDVIRQYPAEDFLKVSERLNDMRGMLFASEG